MRSEKKLLPILFILLLFLSLPGLTGCGRQGKLPAAAGATQSFSVPGPEMPETASATEDEGSQSAAVSGPEMPEPAAASMQGNDDTPAVPETGTPAVPDEDGWYSSKEEVALYIHTYGRLPGNYITKKEAEALGWGGGSLEPYAPGKSIGGSHFGNYEGLLPEGHKYRECDIDTAGAESRGAKRIIYSEDGWIYYTGDHYESFELLYAGEQEAQQ